MRVIAGRYKGRRLSSPKGDIARPTTDKVKEAMFGALQFDIADAVVLDAFAGSGSLGIEALSRGAKHVDFVEKNRTCLCVLKQNLCTIGAVNCDVYQGDVVGQMRNLKTYDIVFLDPPYDKALYLPLLNAAHEAGKLNHGCRIVMECRRKFDFLLPPEYNFTKRKDYGDISLWFLTYGE